MKRPLKCWALETGAWLHTDLVQDGKPFPTFVYLLESEAVEGRNHVRRIRFQSAHPLSFDPDETWFIRVQEISDQAVAFNRVQPITFRAQKTLMHFRNLGFGTTLHGFTVHEALGNPTTQAHLHEMEGAPKLGSDLDPHCVGEEQLYRYCARRFDGRAYAREHKLIPRTLLLHWVQRTDKSITPTEDAFASFFTLEHLHASPIGQLEPATGRLKILQLELFLKLCNTPPPAAYQDTAYMRIWKQCFAGILTLCKGKLRRRYEALLQLECKTDSFETRLDPNGLLEVTLKGEKRVYEPDMGASLVDAIQDSCLKAIVRSFRDLNRFRVVIDIPQ